MLDERERELERVRAYRSDLPEPDDAAVAAARLELMEAIGRAPHASTGRDRRGSRAARSRGQLRRLQRRRRLVLAGGLATIGVAVAGGLGFGTASAPQSALAAQMNQLAKVAASQDWSGIPGPGQYLYTASQGLSEADTMAGSSECAIQFIDHRQSWIATDGSGAISEGGSGGRFSSSSDAATCAAMKLTASSVDRSGSTRFAAGGLTFPTNDWKSLSTDPSTLLKQVHQRDGGSDTAAEWFVNVADFMRESDVPPAIRAALYRAAALIPGVKLLGSRTDPVGQTGLAVA
ncbi:MAG: CU044_5270 family protein, partial [Acidobacteriota bacterium]|nr:CU044_5270 family protein [Acidobacteriota bacterium]